jgi:hypothetical protein
LNNGELGRLMVADKGTLIDSLASSAEPLEGRVERLFLAALSRKPSEAERAKFVEYLSPKEIPHERWRDAFWVLLTSSEFRFNH